MWLTYYCWCQIIYWHLTPSFARRSDTSMTNIIGQVAGGTISNGQGCYGASLLPDTFKKKIVNTGWGSLCAEMMVFPYSPPQRLEANESPLFVAVLAALLLLSIEIFYSEVELFSYFFSFFSPAFSWVILNRKPLQRRVVFFNQPNSKSKSRRWLHWTMQKMCCKSQTWNNRQ